jgi:hypothetical protein
MKAPFRKIRGFLASKIKLILKTFEFGQLISNNFSKDLFRLFLDLLYILNIFLYRRKV